MREDKINDIKEAIYKLSNINTFSDSERTIFRNSANAINYQQQEISRLNNIINKALIDIDKLIDGTYSKGATGYMQSSCCTKRLEIIKNDLIGGNNE